MLFEVKSLSGANEIHQCRSALSQLLEYRFCHGVETDRLCVVVGSPISDWRRAFLEHLSVAVLAISADGRATAIGRLALELFDGGLEPHFGSGP